MLFLVLVVQHSHWKSTSSSNWIFILLIFKTTLDLKKLITQIQINLYCANISSVATNSFFPSLPNTFSKTNEILKIEQDSYRLFCSFFNYQKEIKDKISQPLTYYLGCLWGLLLYYLQDYRLLHCFESASWALASRWVVLWYVHRQCWLFGELLVAA